MKKITIISKQLIKIITFNTSYPASGIDLDKWDYEFKNGICVYNQYKTLINYRAAITVENAPLQNALGKYVVNPILS